MRMRCIVICGLSGYTIFFHIISQTARVFEKTKSNTKFVFWFYLQLLSETFLILGRTERDMIKKMSTCLHVRYPLFLTDFNESWIFMADIRKKNPNMKFHQNSSSGSRVVPRERADRHYESLMWVTFSNFAKAHDCRTETCSVCNYPIYHAALRTANYRHQRESCIISRSVNAWHRFSSERGTEKASLSSVRSDNFLWTEVRPYE